MYTLLIIRQYFPTCQAMISKDYFYADICTYVQMYKCMCMCVCVSALQAMKYYPYKMKPE